MKMKGVFIMNDKNKLSSSGVNPVQEHSQNMANIINEKMKGGIQE